MPGFRAQFDEEAGHAARAGIEELSAFFGGGRPGVASIGPRHQKVPGTHPFHARLAEAGDGGLIHLGGTPFVSRDQPGFDLANHARFKIPGMRRTV